MTQYQLFPNLPVDEYARLRDDIAARGVIVPVELDEEGNVLDGAHRLRACQELGITDYPRIVRTGMSESEKRAHVRALNLIRRHLTSEQKRAVLAEQIVETPERSNRQIARDLGVDDKTVGSVRSALEQSAEIPHFEARQDPRTGRLSQPAFKPRPLRPSTGGILATTEREERREAHQEAANVAGQVRDFGGAELAGARALTAFSRTLAHITSDLLPLHPEVIAERLDEGDWASARYCASAVAEWFARLEAARPLGPRLLEREPSHG